MFNPLRGCGQDRPAHDPRVSPGVIGIEAFQASEANGSLFLGSLCGTSLHRIGLNGKYFLWTLILTVDESLSKGRPEGPEQ
ncbi:hypothetical protein [Cyclobacterium salsum]|uniref:hypothetical protein n=1 Tax=Cyclobacterium salsum TaxID=2666329 RepID=UPI0013918243|nr:hypothetical protein [Cyclobacterium salsum]